jgi:hypothetical protein
MRRVVFLVISTWLLPLTRPAAQQLGQRIRVLVTDATPDQWVVGNLEAQDDDSLRLRVAGQAQPVSVARSSLRRLEVGRGQRRAVFQGAGVGFGLGALVGALTQLGREPSRSHTCGSFSSLCPVEVEARVIKDGLIGGAVGALLGAAIGSAVKTERWEALPLGPAGVGLAPRGAGLGLSFTF